MKFRVQYGFRRDDGMGISTSTSFDACTVEAENEEDARGMAIRVAYQKKGPISHVQTGTVRSEDDKPEPGKVYRLTGASVPSIAGGNSWAESEVAD